MHVKSTLAAALVAVASAAPAATTGTHTPSIIRLTAVPEIPHVTGPPVLSVSPGAMSPPATTMASELGLAPGGGPVWCHGFGSDISTPCSPGQKSKLHEIARVAPTTFKTEVSGRKNFDAVDSWGLGPVINGPEGSHDQVDKINPGPGPVIVDVKRKAVGGEETKLDDKWSKASSPHYVVHDNA